MLELVKAGGWPMIPLLLLGVLALAIVVERFWSLRRKEILPPGLGEEVRAWAGRGDHGIATVNLPSTNPGQDLQPERGMPWFRVSSARP